MSNTPGALIVCVSVSHGNTARVAAAIASGLRDDDSGGFDVTVVAPDQITSADLDSYDLIGFGSGIFGLRLHRQLRDFVRHLPDQHSRPAFVFTTSGFPPVLKPFLATLRRRGLIVVDSFSCRGWDTWLPFRPVGGLQKTHPDTTDLAAARTFGAQLGAVVRSSVVD